MKRRRKITILPASVLLALLLIGPVVSAAEIHMRDGRVYRDVEDVRKIGDVFLFKYNNRNYSINKYKIEKILDDNGKSLFQQVTFSVEKQSSPEEGISYVFYKNNEKVGKGQWNQKGKFSIDSSSIPDGEYKQYYDSGTVEREFIIKNGNLNGVCKIYYDSGMLYREGTFIDGMEQNISKLYYKNGKLKGTSKFVDGLKNGETKLFYESGKVKATMNFKDGEANGEQRTYYESGALETVVTFKDGERAGPIKSYYESGKVKMEGYFRDGKLDGTVTTYYESGRVKKRKTFSDGIIMDP